MRSVSMRAASKRRRFRASLISSSKAFGATLMRSISDSRRSLERALMAAMGSASEMQWGKDDCALWCANILKDALCYDGAERFRGRYRTRIGAGRVLGKAGLAGA